MSTALIVQAVVRDGDVHVVEPFYATRRREAARHWGDGVDLSVTLEPAPLAVSRGQRAYYFAAIVQPLVDHTGYPSDKWHRAFKKVLMPDDGRTSITQLSHEEMREFMEVAECYAVTKHPEAFVDFDARPRKQSRRARVS